MAKCDEGYICQICGQEVASITESDLYLRFVTGMIDPEVLHTTPDRHIRCNPLLAQFIEDKDFEPVVAPGMFEKQHLDSEFRRQRVELVTRGWKRLAEIKSQPNLSVLDYPLPEYRERYADTDQAGESTSSE